MKVTYEQIEKKNYSFSAGQYFEVKIDYTDISPEDFSNRMNGFKTSLENKFTESHKLEAELFKLMEEIGL